MSEVVLPAGLRARLNVLFPGAQIVRADAMRDDETAGAELKALGYGRPFRIVLTTGDAIVFHTARPDDFGHDRRADRVGNLLTAYDTFRAIPKHAAALDVGCVARDGTLVSLAHTGEPYLITRWVDGDLYADDLRRVAERGEATTRDRERAGLLAGLLLEIHAAPGSHPAAYTRAIRDLLGHGEGIFGLVDSYDAATPGASPARLRALEEACLAWRWKLRGRTDRLRRTHGDFHPFNIVFHTDGTPALLDASRGAQGDPADDVACIAINFIFFGAGRTGRPLAPLWRELWSVYLAGDTVDVLAAVAPFFAWRALVLASPRWYPHLSRPDRDRILGFAERALAADRFDPAWGVEAMT